ncbi:DUF58 domain-containing protein [Pelagibius marinus]|uniref:DUF58 domain-containing protein n=1 Tax=Pelagibius marinus TaxID=2762760 RepID=UPI0018733D33|nr:DUF58 domain-containing protein [Pelagibius marinus]
MIRPTPRAVAAFAAGIPLAFALLLADPDLWPYVPAYLFLACFALLADAGLALSPQRLSVQVNLPPALYIGAPEDFQVRLEPTSYRRPVVELLCDVDDNLEQPPRAVAPLDPEEDTLVSFPLRARRRGKARVERLWLRWKGPLGLVYRLRIIEVGNEIAVTPNTKAVKHMALQYADPMAIFGIKPQRQQGEGSEFEALREYVPGLDPRSIDWKHSARHLNLLCKEFRSERNHQIVLAFDTGHLMSEPLEGLTKLDHAVNAGLQLGYISLRAGDRIGVYGFDSQVRLFSQPTGGIGTFWRLQRAAAELDYSSDETNFTLGLSSLAARLDRRSLVILQTEFVDTITAELMLENVERLAGRHLVVFVCLQDPQLEATVDGEPGSLDSLARSVIAEEFLRERRVVLERLRRLGVHCLDVRADQIGTALINRYLDIKRRELI